MNLINKIPSNKTKWKDILNLFNRFKQLGFSLITTEETWKTSNKIKCICENGHIHEYCIAQLKNVKKCNKCKLPNKLSKNEKWDNLFLNIQHYFSNYEITKIFWNNLRDSKLIFKCKCGHEFTFDNWYRYMKNKATYEICPICKEKSKYNWLYEQTTLENYQILDIYDNKTKNIKFDFICPVGHVHHMYISNWLNGQRCGKCTNTGPSKKEQYVAEWIKSLGYDILQNDRTLLYKGELDIVIPNEKLAIEFNGSYWHSSQRRDKNYHKGKLDKCSNIGYSLIHINEYDWDKNENAVKTIIKHRLGINKIVNAYNCVIKEISYNEINEFLEKYSFYDIIENCNYMGIYDKNELVFVVQIQKNIIISFCSKHDISLINWENIINEKYKITKIQLDLNYYIPDNINLKNIEYIEPSLISTYDNKMWDSGKILGNISNIHKISNIEISKKDVINNFNNLSKKNGNYNSTNMYSKCILYFQWKEFYKNELMLWNNNENNIQEKLFNNRLKYINKSKYQLSNLEILRGLKISGLCNNMFSHFSPLWLKAFIEQYNIKSIYDPCGGWGHRLIATNKIKYIYNDINTTTYENCKKLSNFLQLENKIFYNEDAEILIPNDYVDCMFTCPPYLNKEIYSEKGAENYEVNKFKIWWYNVINNSLKITNKIAYIIDKNIDNDIKYNICKDLNLKLIYEQNIHSNINHFQRKNIIKKGEVLLVYERRN